jgi:hypothetical protein
MQYEIKYKYEEIIGTYYIPLVSEYELSEQDVSYSARMAVAKFLGTSQFEIISIHEV